MRVGLFKLTLIESATRGISQEYEITKEIP